MKKILFAILFIVTGFFIPNIVSSIRNYVYDLQNDTYVENIDELKMKFYNNPSKENLDSLWCSLSYQANNLRQYDLFVYDWYVAFQYDSYSSKYTLHRMLTDTIIDENHFIPKSSVKELVQINCH